MLPDALALKRRLTIDIAIFHQIDNLTERKRLTREQRPHILPIPEYLDDLHSATRLGDFSKRLVDVHMNERLLPPTYLPSQIY